MYLGKEGGKGGREGGRERGRVNMFRWPCNDIPVRRMGGRETGRRASINVPVCGRLRANVQTQILAAEQVTDHGRLARAVLTEEENLREGGREGRRG